MGALAGKAVAITGAGRGLGAAYARLAAAEGASVLVNDIDATEAEQTAAAIRDDGGRAIAQVCDIAAWDGAQAMVAACVRAFGGIDGLVNNAGAFCLGDPLEQDVGELRRMVEINLLGSAYAGVAAARAMAAQAGGGAIVNTVSGAQCGSAGMAAYGAAKGGVASLTYSWALDLAPHAIRVNAISPLAFTRQARSVHPDLHRDKPPELTAPAVIYLLSDLSMAVNGQVVFVNGEEIALMSHPAISMPSVHRRGWTVDAVAEVFARDLAQRQAPVGRSRQEIKVLMQSNNLDVS